MDATDFLVLWKESRSINHFEIVFSSSFQNLFQREIKKKFLLTDFDWMEYRWHEKFRSTFVSIQKYFDTADADDVDDMAFLESWLLAKVASRLGLRCLTKR